MAIATTTCDSVPLEKEVDAAIKSLVGDRMRLGFYERQDLELLIEAAKAIEIINAYNNQSMHITTDRELLSIKNGS